MARRKQKFIPAPMPPGRSLLLDLPAELRNQVYKEVTGDAAYVHRTRKTIAGKTKLVRVNKQVHEEVMAFLYRYATETHCNIVSMEFNPLVCCLNAFSDEHLSFLPHVGTPSPRKFVLHLQGGLEFPRYQISLMTWVRRMAFTKYVKKGTLLDYTYVLDRKPTKKLPREDLKIQEYFDAKIANTSAYYNRSEEKYTLGSRFPAVKANTRQELELRKIERVLRGLD